MAALPPEEEVGSQNDAGPQSPNPLPWQRHGAATYGPNGQGMPDEAEAWPGEDGYSDSVEPLPGEEADPNAWPADPGEESAEWVQVLVSGAGMHGVASEEAPMLFAFPYGRTLRVISRYGGWVEVTDPQSATTGWMKAQYLAPVAQPRSPEEMEAWYEEEEPRRRRGWFRRNGGGFADMINRALGGDF